jgi:uncharacterized protein
MHVANASSHPTASSRHLQQVMERYPLFFYFLLAYAFSWIVATPYVLSVWGFLPGFFAFTFYLGPFLGPTLAAFIMTSVTEGKDGVHRWLRRFLIWRFGWQWYAFILLGIPALVVLGILVLPGARESFVAPQPSFVLLYVAQFLAILVLGGPLGEEPGWRGFALPRLLPRYGPLRGSLLLGVLWAGWHLPDFLTPAQHGGPGTTWSDFFTNLPIFVVEVIAMTIIFTWVFNHTRTSIFAAILLHASIDSTSTLTRVFPAPIINNTDLEVLIPFGITALLLVGLTRGRLGYRPGRLAPSQAGGGRLSSPSPTSAGAM